MKFFVQKDDVPIMNAPLKPTNFSDVATETSHIAPRFQNLLHDLRELFCHLESGVPRVKRVAPQIREQILGEHKPFHSLESYLVGVPARSASKLKTNPVWKQQLMREFQDLLKGLAVYASVVEGHTTATAQDKSLCSATIEFCKKCGVVNSDLPAWQPQSTAFNLDALRI